MREVAIIICPNVLESSVVCTLLGTYFFINVLLETMECNRRETRSVLLGTGNTPSSSRIARWGSFGDDESEIREGRPATGNGTGGREYGSTESGIHMFFAPDSEREAFVSVKLISS